MTTSISLNDAASDAPAASPQAWLGRFLVSIVRVRGADARDLLQRLGTQDLRALAPGADVEGLFVTHQGKLVAPVRLLADDDGISLVAAANAGAPLCEWLQRYTVAEEVTYEVVAEQSVLLRLLASAPGRQVRWPRLPGPAVAQLHPQAASDHAFEAAKQRLSEHAALALAAPAFWGLGCDVIVSPACEVEALAGSLPVHVATAAEIEFFRLWVGEPAQGTDYAALVSPLEWRLGHRTIDWHKGCFVGQEVLSRLDNYKKVARFAMGVSCDEGAPQLVGAQDVRVLRDGQPIGKLTSVAAATPARGVVEGVPASAAVGLALIKKESASEGPVHLSVAAQGTKGPHMVPAFLEHRPFWQ